jgi:hypothetical protein
MEASPWRKKKGGAIFLDKGERPWKENPNKSTVFNMFQTPRRHSSDEFILPMSKEVPCI